MNSLWLNKIILYIHSHESWHWTRRGKSKNDFPGILEGMWEKLRRWFGRISGFSGWILYIGGRFVFMFFPSLHNIFRERFDKASPLRFALVLRVFLQLQVNDPVAVDHVSVRGAPRHSDSERKWMNGFNNVSTWQHDLTNISGILMWSTWQFIISRYWSSFDCHSIVARWTWSFAVWVGLQRWRGNAGWWSRVCYLTKVRKAVPLCSWSKQCGRLGQSIFPLQ